MQKVSFFNSTKRNKLLLNYIPKFLTTLRIIMTCYVIYLLERMNSNIYIFICVNILIFITDIADGKLARYLNAVTSSGELLDIVADIFYVFSMSIIMCLKKIIPFYYVLVVIFEFYIFIITSKYIKKDKKYLGFDMLGRLLAVLYYIIPSIMFVLSSRFVQAYDFLHMGIFKIITVLTVLVIVYRIILCYINVSQKDKEK